MKLVKGNYTRLIGLSRDVQESVYARYSASGYPICTDDYDTDITCVEYVGLDTMGEVSLWDDEKSYGEDRDYIPLCDLLDKSTSDGSTASYYQLPTGATELQHLISHKNMNAQIGEIMRSCYRYGESSHSTQLRDAKKIQFYINAEITRLEAFSNGVCE